MKDWHLYEYFKFNIEYLLVMLVCEILVILPHSISFSSLLDRNKLITKALKIHL